MEELIRELEELAEGSRTIRDGLPERGIRSQQGIRWERLDARVIAYETAATLAREAKRRMADREPAWDLQP